MNEDKVPQKPLVPHVTEKPQKAIRTYESDVAEVLEHKNISTTSIALAEQQKKSGEKIMGESIEQKENSDNSQTIKKMLIAIAGLILIGIGVGGGYYLYSLSPLANTKTVTHQSAPTPTSVIPADSQVVISIDNMNQNEIISAVRNEMSKPQDKNTIREIIFTQTVNGQKVRVSGPAMAKIMDIQAPDILLRVLSPDWMLGMDENSNGNKDVFVIATINYFQNAFAGMLQWESVMADDLKQYLSTKNLADIATVSTLNPNEISTTNIPTSTIATSSGTSMNTATTSNATSTSADVIPVDNTMYNNIVRGTFTDRIIQNKDVREFITQNGPLFLYSFIDKNKLVITGKESTLSDIINRLEQKAYIR
jgi:hypothetical protein